jgi:hypothetical protein
MMIRFRWACLKPICTGLFLSMLIALVLQGCKGTKPAVMSVPISASLSLRSVRASYDQAGYDPAKLSGRTEELWILARGESSATESEPGPGSGTLLANIEHKQIPMPLKHTDVRASISGCIGTVEVSQQFSNPYSGKIEAVYVFPLPHNASVNEFIMTIGERRIRGIIRERKEAEQIYTEAKQQGYVASLLTEERPNVFTQRVANIEPGKEIDMDIKYFHTLVCGRLLRVRLSDGRRSTIQSTRLNQRYQRRRSRPIRRFGPGHRSPLSASWRADQP